MQTEQTLLKKIRVFSHIVNINENLKKAGEKECCLKRV